MTGEGGTLERGRQRPSACASGEPPDQESRVERPAHHLEAIAGPIEIHYVRPCPEQKPLPPPLPAVK